MRHFAVDPGDALLQTPVEADQLDQGLSQHHGLFRGRFKHVFG
jgi:hypothetical protein